MKYVNLNGSLKKADQPILPAKNRWLKLGDAVYEQFRVFNGKMPFLTDHVNQLELSVNQLGLEPKRYLTAPFFEKEVQKLLDANGCANAAVTVTIYREGTASALLPITDKAGYLVEVDPLDSRTYEWNGRGLKVALFDEIRQNQNRFASLNTPGKLINVAAARFAEKYNMDEALILNTAGRPIMFSEGALLIFHEGKLKFPVFSEGAPPNILREYLLPLANRMNIDHQPKEISLSILDESEEIMHVNPIRGLQFVKTYNRKKYQNRLSEQLHEKLLEMIG